MSEPSRSGSERAVSPILIAVRRRWRLVVVIVVLVTALSAALSLTSAPVYRSTAKVLISDSDLAGVVSGVPNSSGLGSSNIATEAVIAGLPTVVDRAKARLGDPTSQPGRSAKVALKIPGAAGASDESSILAVQADSHNADYSVRLASAVAEDYVSFRQDISTREIRAARDDLAAKVKELADTGRSGSQLSNVLSARLQQLDTLLILGSSGATVLEGGDAATKVSPQPVRSGILGFLVGLLAGVLAAVVVDRLDRSVRSHEEISALLGVPILGTLPDPARKDGLPKLVSRSDLASASAEAFRSLRTNLKFVMATRAGRSVLITSANPGEGKTFVAANLSLAAASAGDQVILVDLDLRKPAVGRYLSLPDAPGLSDVIAGDVPLEGALISVMLPPGAAGQGRLSYLPPGRRVPNPGELVASEAVAAEIRRLASFGADLMVVDTPPLFAVSDATALAAVVGASAVVVRADKTDRSTLERLRGILGSGVHDPVGVILTGSWGRHQPYGTGYSQAGYDADPVEGQEALALGNGSSSGRARAVDPAS